MLNIIRKPRFRRPKRQYNRAYNSGIYLIYNKQYYIHSLL